MVRSLRRVFRHRLYLIEANAEVDLPKYNSPMYVAAEFGFVEIVSYLLETGGARIDSTIGRDLMQPIHAAAMNGQADVCARLLMRKPDILNTKDDTACRPS